VVNINRIFSFRLWLIIVLFLPLVLWSQTEVQTEAEKDIQPDTLIEVQKEVQKKVQIEQPKLIAFGFKSGASYSTLLIGIPIESMKGFIEPTYGLIFSYIDKRTVGIQIELNYLTKSWEESPGGDYLFTANLNYIEIPMLTTLHFGNKFKFIVNAGPYLTILLNEESNHSVDPTSDYFSYYDTRNPRKGDFGLMGGAGFRLQTKIGLFQAEARYTFGFQNIYDSTETNLDYSNLTTIGVFLSYQFLFSNGR